MTLGTGPIPGPGPFAPWPEAEAIRQVSLFGFGSLLCKIRQGFFVKFKIKAEVEEVMGCRGGKWRVEKGRGEEAPGAQTGDNDAGSWAGEVVLSHRGTQIGVLATHKNPTNQGDLGLRAQLRAPSVL